MSFSSRRRNYLLTPHRRDGLIEWMKSMLQHSFVLDALETTAADTFLHFEVLIEEHRDLEQRQREYTSAGLTGHHRSTSSLFQQQSRLKQLVPTIGSFHTALPLREAFEIYNKKHQLTKRKHIQPSFNEVRHILNLAQIIALRRKLESAPKPNSDDSDSRDQPGRIDDGSRPGQLNGPRMITFDGDQTLYSDGANFESNPRLAFYIYQLLRHGVVAAVVTAAGYEYDVDKYEHRLSGLLHYFKERGLNESECESFYLFGGECNYLLQLGADYRLHPVRETGPGGWSTSTKYLLESPGNWSEEEVKTLLDVSEETLGETREDLNLRGRVIRKRRSVGLIPLPGSEMTRESLDEAVLRVHEKLHHLHDGRGPGLPFCAFNGGTDAWVDCGSKRVGVRILQGYLGIVPAETLHIGDQFLNTGNDYAARDASPCVWIINPTETMYVLKTILRLAGVKVTLPDETGKKEEDEDDGTESLLLPPGSDRSHPTIDFEEIGRRSAAAKVMDVYTGEMVSRSMP